MAGIIDSAIKKPALPPVANPAAPAQPAAQAKPKAGAAKKMTPEAMRVVVAAKKIMAQPQVAQHLVMMMKSAPDPATGIAQAMMFLMRQLHAASKGAAPMQALVSAARDVMMDVIKIGVAAKLFTVSKELVKQAIMAAVKMLTQQAAPQQPPAQAAAPAAPPAPAAAPAAAPAQPPVMAGG